MAWRGLASPRLAIPTKSILHHNNYPPILPSMQQSVSQNTIDVSAKISKLSLVETRKIYRTEFTGENTTTNIVNVSDELSIKRGTEMRELINALRNMPATKPRTPLTLAEAKWLCEFSTPLLEQFQRDKIY